MGWSRGLAVDLSALGPLIEQMSLREVRELRAAIHELKPRRRRR